ncbi:MAG: phosphoethanolamine--lipid A transferase [Pseudomonadales bacterium]|jgi:lipid A ethanolaminephosphotransferase|nr:phosphoethanolamine--lipid A transferase [Pseudomonadales bacterium]
MMPFFRKLTAPTLSITRLILLCALCFTIFYNLAFFRNSFAVYGATPGGLAFLGSLALFLFSLTVLVLSVLCFRYFTKPVLIVVIFGAALANYFMNRFNIVVDSAMLTNVAMTDPNEVHDLLDLSLILQILLFGLLPALVILRTRIHCQRFSQEIWTRLKLMAAALLLLILSLAPFTSYYTSFFREHKLLRYYTNPATFLYSSVKFLQEALGNPIPSQRFVLGLDARIPAQDQSRELLILVVGETVRADHFGLNGYERNTTPRLARENVISFDDVTACGTSTAYSLPCMFSFIPREDFDLDDFRQQENLLDVLTHAGVNVLWRDNNSDSKGVAIGAGITLEDFRGPERNPVCDEECRDIGMLSGLDDYISAHPDGDIVIVLHQLGNHGPAYYKRYPPEFEVFTPVCRSIELSACSDAEITNAYDNALLYTDYFLSETIAFLRRYDADFETALYYMSDHGESLGENGLYLHGLPWLLAPKAQKQVASILWFGQRYRADHEQVAARARHPASHDNYSHTVLDMLEIQSEVFEPGKSLIRR